jgi:hypothetical protein
MDEAITLKVKKQNSSISKTSTDLQPPALSLQPPVASTAKYDANRS